MNSWKLNTLLNLAFAIGFLSVQSVVFSQSKMKPIEVLNFKIDSVNKVIAKERNTQKTTISSYETQESKSNQKVDSLNNEIITIENQISSQQKEKKIKESEVFLLKNEISSKSIYNRSEFSEQHNDLVTQVKKGLESIVQGEFDFLSDEEANLIIQENIEQLRQLPDGKYDFIINNTGEITCLTNPSIIINNSSSPIIKKRYPESFAIPIGGKLELNILTKTDGRIGENDSLEFHMSTRYKDRFLKKTTSGKYFLNGFGSPFISDPILNSKYVEDENVDDLLVPVYRKKIYDIMCNGQHIGIIEKAEKVEDVKVSKGTARKVIKLVTAPIWIPIGLIGLVLAFIVA